MTEKTVWETYSRGIKQSRPARIADIVCHRPPDGLASLAEWPERARLICAAPDLLAACELALEWSDDTTLAVRAAVAKAKGQDTPEPCSEPEPLDPYDAHDQSPTPDEPAPALKCWEVVTQTGASLTFLAEIAHVPLDGSLHFLVGDETVGVVASGHWTAYWHDDND